MVSPLGYGEHAGKFFALTRAYAVFWGIPPRVRATGADFARFFRRARHFSGAPAAAGLTADRIRRPMFLASLRRVAGFRASVGAFPSAVPARRFAGVLRVLLGTFRGASCLSDASAVFRASASSGAPFPFGCIRAACRAS